MLDAIFFGKITFIYYEYFCFGKCVYVRVSRETNKQLTVYTVTVVAQRLFGGDGPGGIYILSIQHWLLRFAEEVWNFGWFMCFFFVVSKSQAALGILLILNG